MAAIMIKVANMAKVANVATFFAAGLEEGADKGAKGANSAKDVTFFDRFLKDVTGGTEAGGAAGAGRGCGRRGGEMALCG